METQLWPHNISWVTHQHLWPCPNRQPTLTSQSLWRQTTATQMMFFFWCRFSTMTILHSQLAAWTMDLIRRSLKRPQRIAQTQTTEYSKLIFWAKAYLSYSQFRAKNAWHATYKKNKHTTPSALTTCIWTRKSSDLVRCYSNSPNITRRDERCKKNEVISFKRNRSSHFQRRHYKRTHPSRSSTCSPTVQCVLDIKNTKYKKINKKIKVQEETPFSECLQGAVITAAVAAHPFI